MLARRAPVPRRHPSRARRERTEQPDPATDWPDDPLSPSAERDLLDREDAVVDVVLETTTGFEMYSYTGGRWMDYGTQRKDDEDAPSMAGTLESYEVLAGESGPSSADTYQR